MAMIEISFNLIGQFVPITITYVTTDDTATGIAIAIDCTLINYDKVTPRVIQII